jgi:hypothetical protein
LGLRLVFARRTPKMSKRWVCLAAYEAAGDDGGLFINHQLRPVYFERRRDAGPRFESRLGCRFLAGKVAPRLEQIQRHKRTLWATCRARGGFRLVVRGELPWTRSPSAPVAAVLGRGKRLTPYVSLGMTLRVSSDRIDLEATTPEAIISFSALLARGARLVLRDDFMFPSGQVIVGLRDFDDAEIELPAIVSYPGGEDWLWGMPPVPLPLDEEGCIAIARWLYPPDSWLDDILEGLW